MIKDLTVLGGGNAGLMVALYLKASYPTMNISVVKSTKIGTIGVGEGSTEHWMFFASAVGIPNWEIVKEAGATLKTGIKFVNWHGDNTSYFHSLGEFVSNIDDYSGTPYTMMRLIGEGEGPESMLWDLAVKGYHSEPLEENFSQFHFDSEKLNSFFLRKCAERNINVIEAEIVDAIIDQEGFVESIVDTGGNRYVADFFVDSSGFRRVIASKLGAKWVDWSKYLPMNSAIAFPSPYEEILPPHTTATALESGWSWRSPVQDRFGNGYVFCDAFTTEDKAIEEIQKLYPDTIQIGRKVNFVSDKIDQFWIKNCVSVGLSSSFVEPLEASSISTTVQQSRVLASSLATWDRNDTVTAKHYNKIFDDVMSNILDFIQIHYFTERNDSEFWKWTKTGIELTDFNKEHLELFKKNYINQLALPSFNYNIFDILNWSQVMYGLRMFDEANIKKMYDTLHSHLTVRSKFEVDGMPTVNDTQFYTSREAINIIKSRITETVYKL